MWCTKDDLQLFTDASRGVGFGGLFNGKWFQGNGQIVHRMPIQSCSIMGGSFEREENNKIIIRSDNEAVVAIVNKETSKCPHIMDMVRLGSSCSNCE